MIEVRAHGSYFAAHRAILSSGMPPFPEAAFRSGSPSMQAAVERILRRRRNNIALRSFAEAVEQSDAKIS